MFFFMLFPASCCQHDCYQPFKSVKAPPGLGGAVQKPVLIKVSITNWLMMDRSTIVIMITDFQNLVPCVQQSQSREQKLTIWQNSHELTKFLLHLKNSRPNFCQNIFHLTCSLNRGRVICYTLWWAGFNRTGVIYVLWLKLVCCDIKVHCRTDTILSTSCVCGSIFFSCFLYSRIAQSNDIFLWFLSTLLRTLLSLWINFIGIVNGQN